MTWSKTHQPCPDTEGCGSSDGAAINKDGSIHCFVCDQHFTGDRNRSTINPLPSVVAPPAPLPCGTYDAIPDRGISKTTCELYHYQQGTSRGKPAHFAQVKGQDGQNCAVHIRVLPKAITWMGTPRGAQLFGQHIGTGSHLVITEGELDAMSVHEAYRGQSDAPVVVSVTSGVGACLKNLEANLTFINQFDRVTIFFDDDIPGIEYSAKAAALIGAKTRIVRGFGFKDANDAWVNGTGHDIRDAIDAARIEAPDDLISGSGLVELFDDLLSPEYVSRGLDLAWDSWNSATHGLRPGELWLIASGTGLGKSTITRSMARHLATKGTKVAYLGLEETAHTTLDRMLSEQMGTPFHLLPDTGRRKLEKSARRALQELQPNLHLSNKFGADDFDEFVHRVEHLVVNEGCHVVFLDHFSMIADGIALSVDQRRAIDQAIKELKGLAVKLNFTFVVVCHLSRGSNLSASHEEGSEPRLSELRGSHSLAQIPDYIWMLQRNPQDQDNSNITICHLKKNRVTGEVGAMSTLEYQPRTCRFSEAEVTA